MENKKFRKEILKRLKEMKKELCVVETNETIDELKKKIIDNIVGK